FDYRLSFPGHLSMERLPARHEQLVRRRVPATHHLTRAVGSRTERKRFDEIPPNAPAAKAPFLAA
ncbi:MAG TPA: hypothetical protein VGL71_05585, partial [Urbifossiella sp.]